MKFLDAAPNLYKKNVRHVEVWNCKACLLPLSKVRSVLKFAISSKICNFRRKILKLYYRVSEVILKVGKLIKKFMTFGYNLKSAICALSTLVQNELFWANFTPCLTYCSYIVSE